MNRLALQLGWRLFRSVWATGAFRVLLGALVLAVTVTSTVGFFTERLQRSLQTQANVLLGADLVMQADHPLPLSYQAAAQQRGFRSTPTMEFTSMVLHGERNALVEIKAVLPGFPLRGALTVSTASQSALPPSPSDAATKPAATGMAHRPAAPASFTPVRGTVWLAPALAERLGVTTGDQVQVGSQRLTVAAWVLQEPSRGGDLFNIAPRLLMHIDDVAATGLVQLGSRVKYQWLLAADTAQGGPEAIRAFADWLTPQLARGERIEDVRSARPELRAALEKAQQFLAIAAMVGVILAMVAMWLASLPYVQSSLDTYALLRCFGATQSLITQILLKYTLLLAGLGWLLGGLLGAVAQWGLAQLAEGLFLEALPSASSLPFWQGGLTAAATLLAVVWPQWARLRRVPALRIWRQDAVTSRSQQVIRLLPALGVLAGLLFWQAGQAALAASVLFGLLALTLVASGLTWLGLRALRAVLQAGHSQSWGVLRMGLMGLRRRPGLSIAQVVGLSMGLMAVLLLSAVRQDLLSNWQTSVPAEAPNRFLINIQADQRADLHAFLQRQGIAEATLWPMVRARLVAVNGRAIDANDYDNERAKRLVEREFNLSWTTQLPADNVLLAGRWWSATEAGQPWLSLEQGLADTLGFHVGDQLRYDVAGTPLTLTITSLRKVDWGSLHVNFFALTPPGLLDASAASYLTSIYLPDTQAQALNTLVQTFPNLTVINVAEVLAQLQTLISKMTHAVEFVFAFSLLAGLAVLYAAMLATRDERVQESTLLRVLGASRRQVVGAMLVEFFAIAALASLVAVLFTQVSVYLLATQVLHLPYQWHLGSSLLGAGVTVCLVPLAAWLVARHLLQVPPRALLQSV